MKVPFTNIHLHVFYAECAPPNFLRVQFSGIGDILARPLKMVIQNPQARARIWRINKALSFLNRKQRHALGRLISFLNASSQTSQEEVFKLALNAAQKYEDAPRLIALSLDMDFMDNLKPKLNFDTQWHQVKLLKRDYPNSIYPFIGVDPRHRSGQELMTWLTKELALTVKCKETNTDIPIVSGIKLYPAHGFFPFHEGLDDLYAFAEKNNIPLMYHCTRVGSTYIGNSIEALVPDNPSMLMPHESDADAYRKAHNAQESIHKRIKRYKNEGWVKDSKLGDNQRACDLFSHPENYVPIMCKYPKLKICLAHMGGDEEVEYMNISSADYGKVRKQLKKRRHKKDFDELVHIWKVDMDNWAKLIKKLMIEYPCLYTDISSTIAHLGNNNVLANTKKWMNTTDNNNKLLEERILFGTDFFLTEVNKAEKDLYKLIREKLPVRYPKMAGTYNQNYLYK